MAISFNGSTSYIDWGKPAKVNLNRNFTVAAWFRLSSNTITNAYYTFVSRGPSSYGVRVTRATNKIEVFESGVAVLATGNTAVNALQWYHVAFTVDADGYIRIYLNGVLDNTPVQQNNTYSDGTGNLFFGKENLGGSGESLFGYLARVGIFSRCLSASEVLYLAGGSRPSTVSNCVLDCELECGNVTVDLTDTTLRGTGANLWIADNLPPIGLQAHTYTGAVSVPVYATDIVKSGALSYPIYQIEAFRTGAISYGAGQTPGSPGVISYGSGQTPGAPGTISYGSGQTPGAPGAVAFSVLGDIAGNFDKRRILIVYY